MLSDPEEVNRLLISGRDYLDQTMENVRWSRVVASAVVWSCSRTLRRAQFLKQRQRIIEEEERAVREGRPPGATVPPQR